VFERLFWHMAAQLSKIISRLLRRAPATGVICGLPACAPIFAVVRGRMLVGVFRILKENEVTAVQLLACLKEKDVSYKEGTSARRQVLHILSLISKFLLLLSLFVPAQALIRLAIKRLSRRGRVKRRARCTMMLPMATGWTRSLRSVWARCCGIKS